MKTDEQLPEIIRFVTESTHNFISEYAASMKSPVLLLNSLTEEMQHNIYADNLAEISEILNQMEASLNTEMIALESLININGHEMN